MPRIALLTSSIVIELLSSSARVTSVKLAKGLLVSELVRETQTHRSNPYIGPQGPIKKLTLRKQRKRVSTATE